MLTKAQKINTLNESVELIKDLVKAGYTGDPAKTLKAFYYQVIEIGEEISQTDDGTSFPSI